MNYLSLPDIDWFARAGTGAIPHSHPKSTFARDIEHALASLTSPEFEQARIVAWESSRVKCLSVPERKALWIETFHKLTAQIADSMRSSSFVEFARRVGIEPDELALRLPLLGAAAEEIAWGSDSERRFFRNAADLTAEGYWVCGCLSMETEAETTNEPYPRSSLIIW